MKSIVTGLVAVMFAALAASATPASIFDKYESVRQALLKNSFTDVQASAKDLAAVARRENQPKIADRAAALATVASLKTARDSFATLSDEVIRLRDVQSGDRPVVVYCPMHKASWLQANGAIANPYADDGSMRTCGQIRDDVQHHH